MHGSTSGGPPNDDDDKEEDDNEVEDNNKDDNKDKGVSDLGLDRPVVFAQTKPNHIKPNQTIHAISRIFAQTRSDSHKLAQIHAK